MSQKTVLLAEPDARLRAEWRAGLAALGLHVREASDGGSAIRAALHSEVALLVTELYLPTGIETCLVRATRREPALRRVKILVVTSHSLDNDRTWALAAGATLVLQDEFRITVDEDDYPRLKNVLAIREYIRAKLAEA